MAGRTETDQQEILPMPVPVQVLVLQMELPQILLLRELLVRFVDRKSQCPSSTTYPDPSADNQL